MHVKKLYLFIALMLGVVNRCVGNAAVYAHNAVQPTQVQPNLVTQTVYGFLDFTTTIGNTVMVFSPQSAPPPELPKAVTAAPTTVKPIVQVIETKPTSAGTKKPEISPSKPVTSKTSSKQLSSVVRVVEASSPQQEEAARPKAGALSKEKNPSSHVEIIDETSKSLPKSIVRVAEQKPPILSSHVEIVSPTIVEHTPAVESKKNKPQIISSVVEIHSSEDLDQLVPVENNINDPEYEFLSREPSELTEETYRLPANKSPNSKFHQKSRAIDNKKPHPAHPHPSQHDDQHPTGLVTKLGGTIVKDGATTVHETSVLGTYISGKYAQVLQSTSHVIANAAKPRIAPTHSLRVLKTAAPHIPKKPHVVESIARSDVVAATTQENDEVDEIYGSSPNKNLVRAQRRPAIGSSSFKNRFRSNRPVTSSSSKDESEYQDSSSSTSDHSTSSGLSSFKKSRIGSKPLKSNRFNRPQSSSVEVTSVSAVFSEPSATPAYSNRRNKSNRSGFKPQSAHQRDSAQQQQQQQSSNDNSYQRRFKPKIQPSSPTSPSEQYESQSSSLYKFKLNRQPGRWQYKTSPKPRVTIRKQVNDDAALAVTPSHEALQEQNPDEFQTNAAAAAPAADARVDETDLDSSSSVNGDVLNDSETLDNAIENKKVLIETLKVEISTPADFKDTYYEIATIKSPYTYQVGSVKNTRYITVTSTFEKTLDPEPTATTTLNGPLTENILATTAHYDRENNLLDSSIATLPPLLLSSDMETPPLETLTETFSTTQTMLKTHILPVLHEGGGNATSYTLTQTYMITRLVTATKTLPPMDAYHFNPSKALKEFNSKLDEAGSELNLELDFGDDNEEDEESNIRHALPDDLDLANIGSTFDISEVDKSNLPEGHLRPKKKTTPKPTTEAPSTPSTTTTDSFMQNLSPEQLQQLALLRLLNPAAAAQLPPQVITTSKPVVKLETVYESHVIPIFNGVSTTFSTISRPVATVSKTEYEIGTSTLAVPQLPLPPQPINPLFQQPQQFQITTAPIVTQTMVTETRSKILKLTFGAKTAYTTLFSTQVVPTILTTYITQSVPIVQPTAAAFPGYFPAPYGPFPYVG